MNDYTPSGLDIDILNGRYVINSPESLAAFCAALGRLPGTINVGCVRLPCNDSKSISNFMYEANKILEKLAQ
jgi:hypothetical protein